MSRTIPSDGMFMSDSSMDVDNEELLDPRSKQHEQERDSTHIFQEAQWQHGIAVARSNFEREQLEWKAHLQRMEGIQKTADKDVQSNVQSINTPSTTHNHTEYASEKDIPYEHVRVLGQGTFGWVDEVQGPNLLSASFRAMSGSRSARREVYARKTIPLVRRKLTDNAEAIRNEIDIIRKLHHQHLVRLVCTYKCRQNFGILMLPVAEGNLKEYLEETEVDHTARVLRMRSWPGCLMRLVQFLHSHKIRHKDIKPANILIRGSQIFLTDFGIAKDLADQTSTATTGHPGFHTALYAPPEVHKGEPRGRAADIYSLGCVFLEMATVMFGASLDKLQQFIETDEIRAYAKNESKVLQWHLYIWASWYDQWRWFQDERPTPRPKATPLFDFATSICDMSFLMMDPDPCTRITAEQLIDLVASRWLVYREIMLVSCETCMDTWRRDEIASYKFLHSAYKEPPEMSLPNDPSRALQEPAAGSWDAAKRKWLRHHVHWQNALGYI